MQKEIEPTTAIEDMKFSAYLKKEGLIDLNSETIKVLRHTWYSAKTEMYSELSNLAVKIRKEKQEKLLTNRTTLYGFLKQIKDTLEAYWVQAFKEEKKAGKTLKIVRK